MIYIRKTILILSVVFAGFYVWFNFGYIIYESESMLGLIGNPLAKIAEQWPYDREPAANQYDVTDTDTPVYLFPISADKKNPAVRKIEIVPEPVINYPYKLSIPSLGVSAPVVLEITTNQDRIYKQLEKGVVHYAETPLPGQSGTSVIIGHSSVYPWYKGNYGHVFASLSKLKPGDVIEIENNGNILSYKVSRSLIFSPLSADDFELRSLEETDGSSIVLMTCWPTGTNSKRVAVRADLII